MYAQFNPDATRVAYVRQNDIYVEDLASGATTRLTRDGTDLVINGGSDWVNEEELDLHDCFRWSPDGARIAFWQFDTARRRQLPAHVLPREGSRRSSLTSRIRRPDRIRWSHERALPARRDDEFGGAGRSRAGRRRRASSGCSCRAMRASTTSPRTAVGRSADAARSAAQSASEHRRATCSPTPRPVRCSRCGAITTRRSSPSGSAVSRRRAPLSDGAEFLVASEKDGWMHVYRVDARRPRDAGHARRHGRGGRLPASTSGPAGCTSWPRRRTRPSAICIAHRSTAAPIRCA